jgi:adenylate cyclase
VMFSDIRNFTQRSERLNASEVVQFLNAVHTPLSDAVMRRGGTVDKYIGDGMMAFWNAPLDDPDHARNGLRAALDMVALAAGIEVGGAEATPGAPRLGIGVSLHTGPAWAISARRSASTIRSSATP